MIVNYKENGWQIISQRAHGLLAGQICYHWKNDFAFERWIEVIIATAEHDDIFNEFEEGEILLNESHGPINFKMRSFEQHKCDKLIHLALTKSRYIGLLISRHIQFLYESSEDTLAKKYCNVLKKTDKTWLKESGVTYEEITRAYAILEWCDAFSLLICQQMIQPENRKIEISKGPDNLCYQLHAPSENILTVDPWPFTSENFVLQYESRNIPQLSFRNEKEFREILLATAPELHRYQLVKKTIE